MSRETLISLDRSTTAVCETAVFSSDFSVFDKFSGPYSVMGSCRSIPAASFRASSLLLKTQTLAHRFLFNPTNTLVTVPAGTILADLFEHLALNGLSLGSVPSYPNVTIGGCIAVNVHGQNHFREGCFRNQVENLRIFHPDRGVKLLSRTSNPELFDLTIGGFGLTGVILDATLRLHAIPSRLLDVTVKPFDSLYECYELLISQKEQFDYCHTWCDLANSASGQERGFVQLARFCPTASPAIHRLNAHDSGRSHWRFCPNFFGTSAIKQVNTLYYLMNVRHRKTTKTLGDFIFPSMNRLYYFSLFGPTGLFEHQVLIPHASVMQYLKSFRSLVHEHTPLIPLCHMKLFHGLQNSISFDGSGFCLAIQVPTNSKSTAFLRALDKLDNECGCIANIAKDSRLSATSIETQYPQLESFRNSLAHHDPALKFQTTISDTLFRT